MSIASIRLRLQTLQQTIPGISRAYAQLPRTVVQTSELPLFMNFVRDADYDDEILGDSDVQVTRTFMMWLLVKPVAEGEEGEGESITEPFIEVVSKFFYARPSLGNLIGVSYSHITKDSGPKKLIWPGTPANPGGTYWGIEFELNVVELFNRVYSTNE